MIIFFVLLGVVTGFSMLVLPSSGSRSTSVSKALFNYTHWTLIWTILFIYSFQVSTFTVLFGQFFSYRKTMITPCVRTKLALIVFFSIVALLAKLVGFVLWILTFIDFYPGAPVGLRYFMCLFPNTGLLFCLQVVLQYERRSCE